jgi:mRNA-degrading endonuclease toxin of MazEF toxin-antitoxin module
LTDDPLDVDYPRRGEVWLVETPNLPDDPHQPRPALIVSEDVRNRLRDHVIVVPIFSAGRLGPTRVALRTGQGGIDHESVLFCEEITTLHREFLVDGPLGQPVSPSIVGRVNRAIRRALGESVPEPS